MHELVETMKWMGIALGWVGALGMSWALVRVGSAPKLYDEDSVIRLPPPKALPVRELPSGQMAKVIPLRQA